MTNPPRSGPDEIAHNAQELAETLLHLSREILTHSTQPELPRLNQLIMQRGRILAELERLDLATLQPDRQAPLREKLEACRKMDESIEQNMKAHQGGLEEQLRCFKDSRMLLKKYMSGQPGLTGTRSEEA